MGHQLFIPLYCNERRVLNPYIFAVNLDELSDQLGSARVGCTVRKMVVNHRLKTYSHKLA